jgi:hypothetical protein
MHTRGFASREETAAAALVVALTRLFLELAAYQRDRGRAHAAEAAPEMVEGGPTDVLYGDYLAPRAA